MYKSLVIASGFIASSAAAQTCDAYLGQVVTPVTFEEALAQVPKVTPKGEFETTAQYEARRSAALGGGARPMIISKKPEDRKFFEYDADNQRLGIKTYAFDNTGFAAWDAIYGTPHAGALNPSTVSNIDVVISNSEKLGDTYEAQNSYGAKAEIQRISRTVAAIYERPVDYRTDGVSSGLFPSAEKAPYMVGYLNMAPADAQRLKPLLKLAFAVVPKEPYFVKNSYSVGKTTVRNPTDITEEATILIADIQCGLVMDDTNKVLAAYPTR